MLAIGVAFFTWLASASSCISYDAEKAHTGYDSFNEDTAKYLVGFSAASYCCGNLGKGVATWTCTQCKCHPQVSFVKTFSSTWGSVTGIDGYLAFDTVSRKLILAVAGTDPLKIQNWIDDADFVPVSYGRKDCPGCQLDQGFLRGYQSVKSQIFDLVKLFNKEFDHAGLYVTGHSLGASVALLAAVELEDDGLVNVTTVYTFGEPRLGNKAMADFVHSRYPKNHWRIVHNHDPIPHLPPKGLLGYTHPPHEVWYPKSSTGSYQVCDGSGEDPKCSDSLLTPVWLPDHLNYEGLDFIGNYLGCKLSLESELKNSTAKTE